MIGYPLQAERCRVWLQSVRVLSAALFHFAVFSVNARSFLIDAVLPHVAVPEHSDHSVHNLPSLHAESINTERRADVFFCMDVTVRSLTTELQGRSSPGLMMLKLRAGAARGPAYFTTMRYRRFRWYSGSGTVTLESFCGGKRREALPFTQGRTSTHSNS
jgi:hypothetical protein